MRWLNSSNTIVSAVSTRGDGNMSPEYGDTAHSLVNRKKFLSRYGIGKNCLVTVKQVHSSTVVFVNRDYTGINNADALITNIKNISLGIHTADCLPIFIHDDVKNAIGLVHAGWRGTREKIIIKTISSMQNNFSSDIKNLYFSFGPAIRACCYEVGESFKDFFSSNILKKDNNYHLDLAQENREQILSLGIKEAQIFDSNICTFCQNKNYFSYRKEGSSCGRMLSIISLK